METKEVISVEVKLELPEYRKVTFQLTYSHPISLVIHVMGLIIIGASIINGNIGWWFYFTIFFLAYLPFGIYRRTTSNYKDTKMLHEPVTYEFTPTTLSYRGTSFNGEQQWSTLYKTQEHDQCFLLYVNKLLAMAIPKRAFSSEEEMKVFREWCGIT
jgi:hypothetical protein